MLTANMQKENEKTLKQKIWASIVIGMCRAIHYHWKMYLKAFAASALIQLTFY